MKPIIVGHRGIAGRYPENTQVSIQAAIDEGLKWVEVDIQPTKDGELVVCHDHTIDRCSTGTGRVDSLTLAELKALDFGGWFGGEFANQTILTLDELLQLAKQYDLKLNLEVKLDKSVAKAVVTELALKLKQNAVDPKMVLLSSFSADVMRELASKCSAYKLGVITQQLTDSDIQLMNEINAYSCHLYHALLTEQQIRQLKLMGRQIWCFTINEPTSFAFEADIDAIFTDYPEKFV
jgi:glycerophosphoryl diester phosphodiesterase